MGVCVADCRADEWLLCVATAELKERLVRRTGRKKKWLKVENIPKERAFQYSRSPARWAPKPRSDWTCNYPAALWLDAECGPRPSLLFFASPSIAAAFPAVKRWDFLPRSGLNDSTERPFRSRRRTALLNVLTCIKQINNREESYCPVWSRPWKKKAEKERPPHHTPRNVKFSYYKPYYFLLQKSFIFEFWTKSCPEAGHMLQVWCHLTIISTSNFKALKIPIYVITPSLNPHLTECDLNRKQTFSSKRSVLLSVIWCFRLLS